MTDSPVVTTTCHLRGPSTVTVSASAAAPSTPPPQSRAGVARGADNLHARRRRARAALAGRRCTGVLVIGCASARHTLR